MVVYQYTQASIEHPDRCEDSIMVFAGSEQAAPVFAVIDGMGGHQHTLENGVVMTGRDASQAIRDVLIEDLERLTLDASADSGSDTEARIIAALDRANQQVFTELNGGADQPLQHRIGAVATVVAVCENAARLLVVQVGDTRAYAFTEGELIQLCEDEDNVEYLVRQRMKNVNDAERVTEVVNKWDGVHEPQDEGTITIGGQSFELYLAWRWFVSGNTALNIPAANVVINSLGTSGDPVRTQRSRCEIAPGDMLLLCSDGCYKNLSEAEIIEGLSNVNDPAIALGEKALARSKDSGNQRRTADDISVIVVKF